MLSLKTFIFSVILASVRCNTSNIPMKFHKYGSDGDLNFNSNLPSSASTSKDDSNLYRRHIESVKEDPEKRQQKLLLSIRVEDLYKLLEEEDTNAANKNELKKEVNNIEDVKSSFSVIFPAGLDHLHSAYPRKTSHRARKPTKRKPNPKFSKGFVIRSGKRDILKAMFQQNSPVDVILAIKFFRDTLKFFKDFEVRYLAPNDKPETFSYLERLLQHLRRANLAHRAINQNRDDRVTKEQDEKKNNKYWEHDEKMQVKKKCIPTIIGCKMVPARVGRKKD